MTRSRSTTPAIPMALGTIGSMPRTVEGRSRRRQTKRDASSKRGYQHPRSIIYIARSAPLLPFPDPPGRLSPVESGEFPAVRLFVEHALTVNSDFAVSPESDQARRWQACNSSPLPVSCFTTCCSPLSQDHDTL